MFNQKAELIVRKSNFDNSIYHVIKHRYSDEKYMSSAQVASALNREKVIVMKKGEIVHCNFSYVGCEL